MCRITCSAAVCLLLLMPLLLQTKGWAAGVLEIGSFSKADGNVALPTGWEPLSLGNSGRQTEYRLVEDAGRLVMQADSANAASALVYRQHVDLAQYPVMQWRWKIANVLDNGDALRKEGDDYPARLYVLFDVPLSELSWFQRVKIETYHLLYGEYPPLAALNYLWANRQPVGSLLPNVYSSRVQMYVLRSGDAQRGEWVMQERNLYEDYLRAFGDTPPPVAGIAIMTDTDNTGGHATAWYGDIRLLPASE